MLVLSLNTSIAIHDALKAVKTKKLKFIYQTFILGKNLEKNLLLVQWLMVLSPDLEQKFIN